MAVLRSLKKQARSTERRICNDLQGFGSKYFHIHKTCKYLEILVAKPITAISHLSPSFRARGFCRWTLFPQSVQAVLETVVYFDKYTLMKFVVGKVCNFPEAWYERLNLAAINPTGFYGPWTSKSNPKGFLKRPCVKYPGKPQPMPAWHWSHCQYPQ